MCLSVPHPPRCINLLSSNGVWVHPSVVVSHKKQANHDRCTNDMRGNRKTGWVDRLFSGDIFVLALRFAVFISEDEWIMSCRIIFRQYLFSNMLFKVSWRESPLKRRSDTLYPYLKSIILEFLLHFSSDADLLIIRCSVLINSNENELCLCRCDTSSWWWLYVDTEYRCGCHPHASSVRKEEEQTWVPWIIILNS